MATIKSIEEKAKAYDIALDKIKRLLGTGNNCSREDLEYVFPELTESKDDLLMEKLINAFLESTDSLYMVLTPLEREAFIAWLEKQGEHKPTDNVEPKFKVDDWVVSPNGVYWHIDAIQDGRYQVSSDSGSCAEWPLDTNIYHRFTIQDAKDGDVLVASDNSIFLFKGTIDCACKHYVALTTDGAVKFNKGWKHYWETSRAVHPATKEQRDLLFQKMKEAGYKWDAEKKELKKIEQKPIKVPKFKVGDFIQFNGMGHTRYTVKEVCGLSHYINTCNKRMDMSYTDANFELVEQEPAEWSEEDERIKNNLLSELTNLSVRKLIEKETEEKYANWLKSLRPQSTWKPSKEQIMGIDCAIKTLRHQLNVGDKRLNSLYDDLKKLTE